MSKLSQALTVIISIILLVIVHSPALAQSSPLPSVISPLQANLDFNGVNLTTGKTQIKGPVLSIPADPRLVFDTVQNSAPYAIISLPSYSVSVHTGLAHSESFTCVGGGTDQCSAVNNTGSLFVGSNFTNASSGEIYNFNLASITSSTQAIKFASSVQYPDGERLTYNYDTGTFPNDPNNRTVYRPNSVVSNVGYKIIITYQANGADASVSGWAYVAQATLVAVSDPTTPLARLTVSGNSITDLAGRVYNCSGCMGGVGVNVENNQVSLTLPGETAPARQTTAAGTDLCGAGMVGSSVQDGVASTYQYTNLRLIGAMCAYDKITINGPNGLALAYNFMFDPTFYQNAVSSVMDSLGQTTNFTLDGFNRVIKITKPEGDAVAVTYQNGMVASKTAQAKPGTGLANISESDNYISACSDVLCWRPTWHRDALGHQTDYVYNAAGQITQQTDPADVNGIQKTTYVTYSTGTLANPTIIRVCGLTTTCGTVNEIRTEYDYWGNTALPSQKREIDAAAGITLTTSYSYDSAGRLLSEDGPLPGTDDAKYYRYDVVGRKTWEIGPKGANGLRPATRYTYRDADDKIVLNEIGTVPDPTSTVLTAYQQSTLSYDAHRNLVRELTSASGVGYAASDATYDDRGQLICSTVRMNLAALPAVGSDACTLGAQGGQGPDRITKSVYDANGQLIQTRKAVGTSLQQAYATYAYSPNGKRIDLIDANGNHAQLTYDGFDRQAQWRFPSSSAPTAFNFSTQATALATAGAVNTGDYEAYGYDANGNRTSLRKRDGSVLTYNYDALNRVASKIVPQRSGLPATDARSIYYGYDVVGHQLTARFDSAGGEGVTNTFDNLGRQLTSSLAMDGSTRTVSYQYDGHGNRIRATFPDGNYAVYNYDALDFPTLIQRADGGTIASYSYDSTGRRITFNSGPANGVATSYTYDAIGRLASLSNNLAISTTYNLTINGSGTCRDTANNPAVCYNPASQITDLSKSNNRFIFTEAYNVNRPYAVNGLNQYTSAGTAAFGYDPNGNLTSDGSSTFLYDVENRLVGASGAKTAALRYDPLGRLYEIVGSSGTTRLFYGGDELLAEYNAGILLRRYVHGADLKADDPLAWYEGSGFSGSNQRILRSDWEGSIVMAADDAGQTVLATNTYDEFGIPGSGNAGRFQYTGQAWIPEIGMYYYKARIYSPTLGRFMQTDPIGYKDQVNLYAYVGNDPVNGTDPTGLATYYIYPNGDVKVVETFHNSTSIPNKAIETQGGRFNGPIKGDDGKSHSMTVEFKATTGGKADATITTNPSLRDASGSESRSNTSRSRENGSTIQLAPNAPAGTAGHEMGHSVGATDQYTTDGKGHLTSATPGVMGTATGPANGQTRQEIYKDRWSSAYNTIRYCDSKGKCK